MLTKRVMDCLDCQITVCVLRSIASRPVKQVPPQSLPHQMKAIYWLSGIVSYLKYFLNAAEKETMSGKQRAGLADRWFALLIAVAEGCKEAGFSRKPLFAFTDLGSWWGRVPWGWGCMEGAACLSAKKTTAQSDLLNCSPLHSRLSHPSNLLPPARPHPSKITSPAEHQPVK